MRPVTRYQANDGTLWGTEGEARDRDLELVAHLPWPRRATMSLHPSGAEAYEAAQRAGVEGTEALGLASHAVPEVTCEVDFDRDGNATLVSVTYGTIVLRPVAP